jgi:ESCRT-II complex subunit VPS22
VESISEDDIRRSVQKLHVLGSGFRIIDVGGRTMVISVPMELSDDHGIVLKFAEDPASTVAGMIKPTVLCRQTGWDAERADRALKTLVTQGVAWIDDQGENGERQYWFPSFCLSFNSQAQEV